MDPVSTAHPKILRCNSALRLMLLSKDKQNLLKIISFDFLVVCMQVTRVVGLHKQNGGNISASLDDNIWEFEWKRLSKHSKKFLAPVILLGYFRDILRLGQISHGHVSLDKILHESKVQVQKVSRKFRAIPRFCDFVTGTSQEKMKTGSWDRIGNLYV